VKGFPLGTRSGYLDPTETFSNLLLRWEFLAEWCKYRVITWVYVCDLAYWRRGEEGVIEGEMGRSDKAQELEIKREDGAGGA